MSLGRIVLALACNSFHAIQREQVQQSMELVTSNYRSVVSAIVLNHIAGSTNVWMVIAFLCYKYMKVVKDFERVFYTGVQL